MASSSHGFQRKQVEANSSGSHLAHWPTDLAQRHQLDGGRKLNHRGNDVGCNRSIDSAQATRQRSHHGLIRQCPTQPVVPQPRGGNSTPHRTKPLGLVTEEHAQQNVIVDEDGLSHARSGSSAATWPTNDLYPPASSTDSRITDRNPPRPAGTTTRAAPRSAISTAPPSARFQRRRASAGSAIWPLSETRYCTTATRPVYKGTW